MGRGQYTEADAARGQTLYQGCEDCHSIDKNDVGPLHRGIVGRTAGTVPGYGYSATLKSAKIVRTEDNLNKWLTNLQERRCFTKSTIHRIALILLSSLKSAPSDWPLNIRGSTPTSRSVASAALPSANAASQDDCVQG
jgi:hypothetical protein